VQITAFTTLHKKEFYLLGPSQPPWERGQERDANPEVKMKDQKKLIINSAMTMITRLVIFENS
jgi:hypothetical protein